MPMSFPGLHMQRNIFATKCHVGFNKTCIHQCPSSIIIQYSSQINTDHASSCSIVLFDHFWAAQPRSHKQFPYKMPLLFFKAKAWTCVDHVLLLQNAQFYFDKLWWSSSYSSCHATKCHCDFHGGRTLLTWFLYNMRFASLYFYSILDLDFMSRLAWLKWKPL